MATTSTHTDGPPTADRRRTSRPPDALLGDLEREWDDLVERPIGLHALRRWSATEPALADINDLEHLRATVHRRGAPARSDELLAALARLAATDCGNDPLAARVLLQLLLPGAAALAYRLRHLSRAEAVASVLAVLSCRIRTYPWQRRPQRIAANLLLDTEMDLRRERRQERDHPELSLHALADRLTPDGIGAPSDRLEALLAHASRIADQPLHPAPQPSSPDTDPREQAIDLLRWAETNAIITDADSALITATDLHQRPLEALAEQHQIASRSLARRRQRALARLRAARSLYLSRFDES